MLSTVIVVIGFFSFKKKTVIIKLSAEILKTRWQHWNGVHNVEVAN